MDLLWNTYNLLDLGHGLLDRGGHFGSRRTSAGSVGGRDIVSGSLGFHLGRGLDGGTGGDDGRRGSGYLRRRGSDR